MKLCLLADAGSIHTRRWAVSLSERGHDVTVLSLRASACGLPAVASNVHTRWRRPSTGWSNRRSLGSGWRQRPAVCRASVLVGQSVDLMERLYGDVLRESSTSVARS